jgi:hypothetical protein
VGGMSPLMAKPTTANSTSTPNTASGVAGTAAGSVAAGVKKIQPRATRQSVGGDLPRPKVTK